MSASAASAHGLPEALPAGERLLWQGGPSCWVLARRVLQVRKIAAYFALLMLWRQGAGLYDGLPWSEALLGGLWVASLGVVAVALLTLIAWLIARSTVYTITSARVVMRFGVAIPVTLNLPFARIESAALRRYPDGSGDLPLALARDERVAYVHLWPHVRPRHLGHPQPMLRGLADAAAVAQLLATALRASSAPAPVAAAPGRSSASRSRARPSAKPAGSAALAS